MHNFKKSLSKKLVPFHSRIKMATLMCSLCKRPLSTVLRVKPQIISPGSHFARLFRTNPVFLQNNETPIANVFDRKAKFYQRERAAQVLTIISPFNRMQ